MTDTTDSSTGPGAGSQLDDVESPLPDRALEDKDLEMVSGGTGDDSGGTGDWEGIRTLFKSLAPD